MTKPQGISQVQRTRQAVLSAILKLTMNTGWSLRTIIKFIKTEKGINNPKIGRKISRALKSGVKRGLLRMDHGLYRLNTDLARIALGGAREANNREENAREANAHMASSRHATIRRKRSRPNQTKSKQNRSLKLYDIINNTNTSL